MERLSTQGIQGRKTVAVQRQKRLAVVDLVRSSGYKKKGRGVFKLIKTREQPLQPLVQVRNSWPYQPAAVEVRFRAHSLSVEIFIAIQQFFYRRRLTPRGFQSLVCYTHIIQFCVLCLSISGEWELMMVANSTHFIGIVSRCPEQLHDEISVGFY